MSHGRIESELKFRAEDDAPLRALAAAPTLGPASLGPARPVDETDRYLDTADLRLAAAGWACRVRSRQGRTTLSLKGRGEHDAADPVHRRSELEGPAHTVLDPTAWPPSAARDLLLGLAGGQSLHERFTLVQARTERDVSVAGVSVGLLSLDRSRVVHRGVELGGLWVVELEFGTDGVALGLHAAPLAAALAATPGLVRDPLTKLEHALDLLAQRAT